jgi:hypothetical protein
MDTYSSHLVVAEVATQLGVSPQRVRALLAGGDLTGQLIGKVWLIDPDSLARYRHVRQPRAGRALAPTTAWAALLTSFADDASDELIQAFHIVDERRSRLRALRERDVDDWRWLARRRATAHRYATRPSYLTRIAADPDVIPAGLTAGTRLELASGAETVDVYVDARTAERLTSTYRLRPAAPARASATNVTLRTINITNPVQLAAIRHRGPSELLTAVDMLEDRDTRTAAAGRELLSDLLHQARLAAR